MILCLKVGYNGDSVFLSGSAIDEVINPAQNGSIFLKISTKVFATSTLKYFQNVKSSIFHRLLIYMPERRIHFGIQIRINQLLIFTEKFSPLPGFEPGTHRYQADMLPIELSWLG